MPTEQADALAREFLDSRLAQTEAHFDTRLAAFESQFNSRLFGVAHRDRALDVRSRRLRRSVRITIVEILACVNNRGMDWEKLSTKSLLCQ